MGGAVGAVPQLAVMPPAETQGGLPMATGFGGGSMTPDQMNVPQRAPQQPNTIGIGPPREMVQQAAAPQTAQSTAPSATVYQPQFQQQFQPQFQQQYQPQFQMPMYMNPYGMYGGFNPYSGGIMGLLGGMGGMGGGYGMYGGGFGGYNPYRFY